MRDVVPSYPSLTIRQNCSVTGENLTINHDCSDRCVLTKYAQWWMFRHFVLIWSTLAGFQELAAGFEPRKNWEIFWINNKWAHQRKMLFSSSSSNGRIPPDKNTNALSPSSPGIIHFIELPSANRVTSLFSRSCITSCLRWAEQQIRNKIFEISGRK